MDGVPQIVDLSGDVENRRREILHAAGAQAGSATDQAVEAGYQVITQGRHTTAVDNSGRGCGKPTDQGSPPPTRNLEEDTGVVSRSSRPHPTARSSNTRADYSGIR